MAKATVSDKVSRVLTEDILSVSEARAELARVFKQRPDKSTVIRWITTKRLDGIKLGRSWFTSTQALNRMITANTEAAQ